MKAMSLRMSMQTLSPCLTPSDCRPEAMRSARSATSSWPRRRWPLMMPWKREGVVIVAFRSGVGLLTDPHGEEPAKQASRTMRPQTGLHPSRRRGVCHRAALCADPVALLRMRVTPPPRISARASRCWRGRARIVDDAGGKAIAKRFLRREDAAGIGQLAQDVVANQTGQDRRARHVRHQAPFDLHDRHARIRCHQADVGAERELEAAAKGNTRNCRNHRHRQLPPAPHRLLREVGEPMGALGKVTAFATGYSITAL